MDALLKEWQKLTGTHGTSIVDSGGRNDSVRANLSDMASVTKSDKNSDDNSELCDGPYKRKDSFGINVECSIMWS